ncbi:MAG TPA: right-handed parallel beta-helix repeat-containing protein, partial [Myxococcota bacterium]|nr:right-handed parallel beta-helix repeat-containing protein [Myxococcota bacterium]
MLASLFGCGGVGGDPYGEAPGDDEAGSLTGDADTTGATDEDPPSPGGTGAVARTLYVAPDGDDGASGAMDAPLASLAAALARVPPAGTVVMRGGVYRPTTAVRLQASGDGDSARLTLMAQPGESVTLDFADNTRHAAPPQPRVDDSLAATGNAVGLLVTGDWWRIEGLAIRNAAYYGVRVYGSHNVLARLDLAGNKASGLEITGKDWYAPADNLVVDCDSHDNFDPQGNGEDADGFAAKFDTLGPGNVFRRTRAWSNSDDGYDFWHA